MIRKLLCWLGYHDHHCIGSYMMPLGERLRMYRCRYCGIAWRVTE